MILTLPIDRPFTVTIYVVSFSYFIRLAFQRICLNWHACIVDTYKDVSWLFTLHTISNRECFFVVVVGWLKRCANICGIDLRYVYTTIFDYFLCVNAAYIVRIENHVERNWAPNNRCFARVYVICGCCFFFFLVGILFIAWSQTASRISFLYRDICCDFFSRVHSEYRMTHSYALFNNRI